MIPYCILVIEDDDDRAFMEQLFVDYHRLMYHENLQAGSRPVGRRRCDAVDPGSAD